MDMSFLDIVVIVLVVLLGLKGLFRGLIKEVFGLASIVGGVFFASRFAYDLGSYINANFLPIENDGVKSLVGFIALFLLIWGSIQLSGTAVSKMVKMSGLGFVDKIGGAAVGSAKIILIFSIIAYGLGSIGFINNMLGEKFKESIIYPILYTTGSYIVNMDSSPMSEAKKKIEEEAKNLSDQAKEGALKEIVKDVNESVIKKLDLNDTGIQKEIK